jgi:tryptophan synthase beta chain
MTKGRNKGWYGRFGGRFAPETLMPALIELESGFAVARRDPAFRHKLADYLENYAGRPTSVYEAKSLAADLGRGIRVFLKREDLCHTGAHKINNAIGQALLAARMGKRRVVAETGAGQHGVATATAAALLGLECVIYMGSEDTVRQALNVTRMEMLGARVVAVDSGTRTLKDAINEAFRDWVTNVQTTHYIFGSAAGPHPYPMIVKYFQSVIGREARRQMLAITGRLPTHVAACVNGGSNAIGIFSAFIRDPGVALVGIEAAGTGYRPGRHAATLTKGTPGILHGSYSYLLQDADGQVLPTHSIAPGLDYPGVGPEHSQLMTIGRATYHAAGDRDALAGFQWLARREGILPALEPAHVFGYLKRHSRRFPARARILVCLSGRGDKDVAVISALLSPGNRLK